MELIDHDSGSPKEKTPLTAGSLFAGIGGLDLGFERAGINTKWQVECDQNCQRILRRHFPGGSLFEDVQKVGAHNLPPVDIVHGGFPCPDLSKAGKGAGLAGDRSGLWFHFARIIDEHRPQFVVVENVRGLLSKPHRGDFAVILQGLGDLGYGWAYRVFDAQFFNLAQRRERLFIVASLGSLRCAEILFEPNALRETSAPRPDTISSSNPEGGGYGTPFVTSGPQMFDARGIHRERMSTTTSPTLTCYEKPMLVSPTLRYLTPTECERLQGFPDGWTAWGLDGNGQRVEMKDSTRYRMLGNAVSVPIAEWIARRIRTNTTRQLIESQLNAALGQPKKTRQDTQI